MMMEDRIRDTGPALDSPRLLRRFAYVGGAWQAGRAGRTFPVTNPADGTQLAEVALLSDAEAREAVAAAQGAYDAGVLSDEPERRACLARWADLIEKHRQDLVRIMVAEQGKPHHEALGEVAYAAGFPRYYAGPLPDGLDHVAPKVAGARTHVHRVPLGVAALITPWNFPLAMLTRKAAAAIHAGCTVVAHPSPETPLSALALAELAEEAGFAPGVFNLVTGPSPEIVGAWMTDARVRVVSFTGSTEIGKLIYTEGAPTMKRLILELGGHAPFLVFADADLDRAVESAISAKFATSGQDCLGANRFLVERPVYDTFCERFAARVAQLRVGPGHEDPDIGPLINASAVAKQQAQVDDALRCGARLLTGRQEGVPGPNFYAPTVLADVPFEARIMSEETFGPVAALAPFDAEEEAVTRANDTDYGLVAYVHSTNKDRIERVASALLFGMIAVNRTSITGPSVPFGGVKQSGLCREGSPLGRDAFTEIKYLCEHV
ncbi:MAG: NAD-dependent succinate-semialdehyde dehydrogenase [Pseudomonadota bacterium]